ncbi:MAG: hypothetical protein PHQ23_07960 [Candidatus Wallbacteria bacterium]|nr:hypothetical protein [Candidatus Wallbacteria bacterium]
MKSAISYREAAQILGISTNAVYSLVKNHSAELNGGLSRNEQGRKTISREALETLRKYIKVDTGAIKPELSRKPPESGLVSALKSEIEHLRTTVKDRDELVKSMIENQADEKKRADMIIMTLTRQVESYRLTWESYRSTGDHVETTCQDDSGATVQETAAPTPETGASAAAPPENWDTFRLTPLPDEMARPEKLSGIEVFFYSLFYPAALRGRIELANSGRK